MTLLIVSCVTQKYQSPGLAVRGQLFRDSTSGGDTSGAIASGDTATIATLPYTSLFADTILQGLIAEGLRENPDLKVAMERMNEAAGKPSAKPGSALPDLSANAMSAHPGTVGGGTGHSSAYIGAYPLTTTHLSDQPEHQPGRRISGGS